MNPIKFDEVNTVIGENQPEYEPLPAFVRPFTVEDECEKVEIENGEVVSCWELSDEEIADIVKNRKVWLSTLTFGGPFQPVLLTTKKEDLI
jgi:hypothetical protein